MATKTETYSVNTDGIEMLALSLDLDEALIEALDGPNHIEIATAIDTAVTEMLTESGWDGDWSATAIVTAILTVADEADILAEDITARPQDESVTVRHSLQEGHEHDHGTDGQGTVLAALGGATRATERPYILPADVDDGGAAYRRAFRAADCYLAAWLTIHGVDPAVTGTHGTGWDVTFGRSQWR